MEDQEQTMQGENTQAPPEGEKPMAKTKAQIEAEAAADEAAARAAAQEWLNERIPFTAFKDNDKYKDDILVTINGKNWQIQRGKTVFIPRYVYDALEASERQKGVAAEISEGFSDQYEGKRGQLE